jgi:hypothetical protein
MTAGSAQESVGSDSGSTGSMGNHHISDVQRSNRRQNKIKLQLDHNLEDDAPLLALAGPARLLALPN